jgi:phosphoglycolate phosphatase
MSTVIFDFDGTIADNFFIVKDVFRTLVHMSGRRHPTDEEEIEILRSLSAREAIKRVKVRWWQLPYILYYAQKQIHKRRDEISPAKGMPEVLQALHERGHDLFIVTSNSQKNTERFLKMHNLDQYFTNVYAGLGLFNKAKTLQKIADERGIATKDAVYIGDEARDVETAHKVGMPCISVTWGYNNIKGINRSNPDKIVNDPKELLKLV